MNSFRIGLVSELLSRFGSGAGHREVAEATADNFMERVRTAIETPGISPEIDTLLVRTAMGKAGTRRDEEVARAFGKGEDPETRALVDLYARIYALERQAGGSIVDASKAARFACGVIGIAISGLVDAETMHAEAAAGMTDGTR